MSSISPAALMKNAALDCGVIGIGQELNDETPVILNLLNRLVGQLNARKHFGSYMYSQVFTLSTSAASYTIGPSAESPALTVTTGPAPISIDSAKRVTTDTPPIETPISVLTFQEWDSLSTPALDGDFVQAVYLQETRPLPTLYVYPATPPVGSKLRLSWRNMIAQTAIADIATDWDLMEGYEDMITRTLAEMMAAGPFRRDLGAEYRRMAREARSNCAALNGLPPIVAPDYPSERGHSSTQFLTRDF